MTNAFLFPGQGSHRVGMGSHLFDTYPNLVRQADSALGYSIRDLCLSGPAERLNDTRYTQCAMYVIGALSYVDEVRRTGVVPDVLAGHSLGEYVALFASGAFDFRTGLELVAQRARLMADAGPGAMAAVIGPDVKKVGDLLAEHELSAIDIANVNAPDQTVIAGPVDDVRAAVAALSPHATSVVPLRVSGAFHSRYMADASRSFGEVLDRYVFARLKIPVIANVTATPYGDDVAATLRHQLTNPVRWTETVRYLLGLPGVEIHEVGPGTVLSGLTKRIRAAGTLTAVGHS